MQDTISRVRGRGGSRRPPARRRRLGGGGGTSGPTHTHGQCLIVTDITAASYSDDDPKRMAPGYCEGYLFDEGGALMLLDLGGGDPHVFESPVSDSVVGGSSLSLNWPSPPSDFAGHYVLLFVAGNTSSRSQAPGIDWVSESSEAHDGVYLDVWSKDFETDDSGTLSVTLGASGNHAAVLVIARDILSAGASASGSNNSLAPDVVTESTNALVFAAAASSRADGTSDPWSIDATGSTTPATRVLDVFSGGGAAGVDLIVARKVVPDQGNTGAGDDWDFELNHDRSGNPNEIVTMALESSGRVGMQNRSLSSYTMPSGKALNGEYREENGTYVFTLRDCPDQFLVDFSEPGAGP
ncbi:MAG: hypothetical protein AAGJ46_20895 [Planctomycetota bacterium]